MWAVHSGKTNYGNNPMNYSRLSSVNFRKEKLLLMSWCPDTARIKKKMLYSSSFDALKKALVGVQKYFQVCFL